MSNVTMVGVPRIERGRIVWEFSETASAKVSYWGPYEMLISQVPKRGAVLPELPTLRVVSARVEELEGGGGEMQVTFDLPNYQDNNDFDPDEPLADPEYEIRFNEGRRAITSHPKCGYVTGAAAKKGLKIDDWEELAEISGTWYSEKTGGWDQTTYLNLRRDGVDDYLISEPVVRRTLYYAGKPTEVGKDCFKRETPPVASFTQIAAFDWLKGADSAIKQGRFWRRDTEWIGTSNADGGGWDTNIYPNA